MQNKKQKAAQLIKLFYKSNSQSLSFWYRSITVFDHWNKKKKNLNRSIDLNYFWEKWTWDLQTSQFLSIFWDLNRPIKRTHFSREITTSFMKHITLGIGWIGSIVKSENRYDRCQLNACKFHRALKSKIWKKISYTCFSPWP